MTWLLPLPIFSWTVPSFPMTTETVGYGFLTYTFSIPEVTGLPSWLTSISTSLATSLGTYILAWIIWAWSEPIYVIGKALKIVFSYAVNGINYVTNITNNLVNLFFNALTYVTQSTGIFAPIIIALIFIIMGIIITTVLTKIPKILEMIA